MNKYRVRDTILMLPQFGPDGTRLGVNKDVPEGTVLTEEDLAGLESLCPGRTEELVAQGSISLVSEGIRASEQPAETEPGDGLDALTKKELAEIAVPLGIDVADDKALKAMKKNTLVEAIRTARAIKAAAEEAEEQTQTETETVE